MPPKIALWSLFRDNSGDYLARYRQRILALDYPPHQVRLYLVEGDSQDDTLNDLRAWAIEDSRLTILKCDTGLPRHGSTTHPERFEILRQLGNVAVEAIIAADWPDLAMCLESDLEYQPDLLQRLVISRAATGGIIAPMIWTPINENGDYRFYDIWAFRYLDGQSFQPFLSAWYVTHQPGVPFEVESVGSVVLFPMEALRAGARYDSQVIRGFCLKARELGYKVFCDPTTHVLHPAF